MWNYISVPEGAAYLILVVFHFFIIPKSIYRSIRTNTSPKIDRFDRNLSTFLGISLSFVYPLYWALIFLSIFLVHVADFLIPDDVQDNA